MDLCRATSIRPMTSIISPSAQDIGEDRITGSRATDRKFSYCQAVESEQVTWSDRVNPAFALKFTVCGVFDRAKIGDELSDFRWSDVGEHPSLGFAINIDSLLAQIAAIGRHMERVGAPVVRMGPPGDQLAALEFINDRDGVAAVNPKRL